MYDPTQGRFLQRDPIGAAGGLNLYGFAGSNPTNALDPMGLEFYYKISKDENKEGAAAEEEFFQRLGAYDAKAAAVIAALRKHPDFERIWGYLRDAEWSIELKVTPDLSKFGTKTVIFGGFGRSRLELNPTHPEARINPMELVDTLIHESIHAALLVREEAPKTNRSFPLGRSVMDIGSDPTLKKGGITPAGGGMNKRTIVLDKALKEYCDKNYGDFSPPGNPPRTTYIDINKDAQKVVVGIIQDLLGYGNLKKLGVKPTLTFKNLESLKK